MMFLLLGLGLTQYFSEALTWFWESSPLIKYSGKWLTRDSLLNVCEASIPLPMNLLLLVVKCEMESIFSSSSHLVAEVLAPESCPVTVWRAWKLDRFCSGLGSLFVSSVNITGIPSCGASSFFVNQNCIIYLDGLL